MINQRLKSILTRQTLFTIAYYLVFSIVLFVIIFRVYQPELLNFRLQPFFAYDNAYYDYFSNMHFGNLRLISQFILQYMAYPVAGTLLLMVLLVGLSLSLFFLLGLKKYHYLRGIEFIPAILILSSLKSYTVGIELLAMALLAVLPALIGQLIPKRFLIPRIVYYLAVMLGLFIIFDLFTASLFAVVCSLTEIRVSGSIWRFAMPVLALISIWILKIIYLEAEIMKPMLLELNADNVHALIPGFWQFSWTLTVLFILTFLIDFGIEKLSLVRIPAMDYLLLIPVALIMLYVALSFNKLFVNPEKYKAQIEYYASEGKWNEIYIERLDEKIEPLTDRIAVFELNRALYHRGLMADKLFTVPQYWGIHGLFLTTNSFMGNDVYFRGTRIDMSGAYAIHNSDLFFDMGFIKAAGYWALEAQTHHPYSPRVFKRMALCAILMNDWPIADKYLTILEKSPVHRSWVRDIRNEIRSHRSDQIKQRLFQDRKIRFDILYIDNHNPQNNLMEIMRADRNNKMVFEYLLSFYILQHEPGNFFYVLNEFSDISRTILPTTYQEMLCYAFGEKLQLLDLGVGKGMLIQGTNLRLSEETKKIIQGFYDAEKIFGNMNRAKAPLQGQFSGSYSFYRYYTYTLEQKASDDKN